MLDTYSWNVKVCLAYSSKQQIMLEFIRGVCNLKGPSDKLMIRIVYPVHSRHKSFRKEGLWCLDEGLRDANLTTESFVTFYSFPSFQIDTRSHGGQVRAEPSWYENSCSFQRNLRAEARGKATATLNPKSSTKAVLQANRSAHAHTHAHTYSDT